MLNAAVQVNLIRRADVEQQRLEFGPQGRWQKTIMICGKKRLCQLSVLCHRLGGYTLFQVYVSQFARVITAV